MSGVRVEIVLPPAVIDAIVVAVTEQVLAALGEQNAVSSFVTPTEAAEILACPRQRIYDLASAGRLPRFKENGRTLHRRADVLVLVKPERRK